MFFLISKIHHSSPLFPPSLVLFSAVALLVGEKVQEETTLVVSSGVLPGQWEDVDALQWVIVFSLKKKKKSAEYIDISS